MAEPKKRAEKAMGGKSKSKAKPKSKPSGKKVKKIHLRRTADGKLLATHEHQQGGMGEPPIEDEEHVVPEGGLEEHVAQHLPAEQEQPPAPAAPQPAPGGMMGGM